MPCSFDILRGAGSTPPVALHIGFVVLFFSYYLFLYLFLFWPFHDPNPNLNPNECSTLICKIAGFTCFIFIFADGWHVSLGRSLGGPGEM